MSKLPGQITALLHEFYTPKYHDLMLLTHVVIEKDRVASMLLSPHTQSTLRTLAINGRCDMFQDQQICYDVITALKPYLIDPRKRYFVNKMPILYLDNSIARVISRQQQVLGVLTRDRGDMLDFLPVDIATILTHIDVVDIEKFIEEEIESYVSVYREAVDERIVLSPGRELLTILNKADEIVC